MKTYEVELKYEAHTVVTVEAHSLEEAEKLAWRELELDGSDRSDYGEWNISFISELPAQENAQ